MKEKISWIQVNDKGAECKTKIREALAGLKPGVMDTKYQSVTGFIRLCARNAPAIIEFLHKQGKTFI